jgi:murein DD-endopeptidase MepM/ murein hydrolase activator NlpD
LGHVGSRHRFISLTFTILIALATALLLVPVGASAERTDQGSLSEARERVRSVRAQLGTARDEVATAEAQLAEAEAQLAELEAAVNEAAAALERQELAVADAEGRLAALETEIGEQRETFSQRAADMYKRGVGVPFAAILEAGSMDEALDRGAYVQALSASDRASLERIIALGIQVDAERERLAEERDVLAEMKAEQEELLAEVAELREHRALQLASAEANVKELEDHLDAAQADAERIERIIAENEREAREAAAVQASAAAAAGSSGSAAGGSVSRSGHIWPRCDRVTSEYGMRWGRMHQGIDINGNTGDPIHASKAGRVIFAGSQGGYGRLILIDHGDGVTTAYAHLSAFSVGQGQSVSQGQRIGSVGSTGQSTGPHLHFETRVNGSPENPRNFLPSGC